MPVFSLDMRPWVFIVSFAGVRFVQRLGLHGKGSATLTWERKHISTVHPDAYVFFPTINPKSTWRRRISEYKYIEVPVHVHGVRHSVFTMLLDDAGT
jgi:hypothetical protein